MLVLSAATPVVKSGRVSARTIMGPAMDMDDDAGAYPLPLWRGTGRERKPGVVAAAVHADPMPVAHTSQNQIVGPVPSRRRAAAPKANHSGGLSFNNLPAT